MSRAAFLLSAAFLLAVVMVAVTLPTSAQSTGKAATDYRLVVGDGVQIVVQGHPELDRAYAVPANGEVSFPPLGRLDLLDRTTGELEVELAKRLKESGQLTDPSVFVLIAANAPRRAFLMGAVNRAIDLPVHEHYTIVEVLSMAGASPALADLQNVKIIRKKKDGGRFPIPVNVDDILLKNDYERLLNVMAGDIIYVPPFTNVTQQAWVYILGKVNSPGEYAYTPGREQMTLLKLLAKAGDFNQYARPSKIKILRKEGGRTFPINIDFSDIIDGDEQDVVLKENDLVFVPESVF